MLLPIILAVQHEQPLSRGAEEMGIAAAVGKMLSVRTRAQARRDVSHLVEGGTELDHWQTDDRGTQQRESAFHGCPFGDKTDTRNL